MLSRKRNRSEDLVSLQSEQSVKRVRFTGSMVGVPRSKGCRMCVSRRVKCDQTRPFCNRCIKGNRECPGYEPSIKFQDEGPKLRELYRHDTSEHISGATSTYGSSEDPQFEYTTDAPLTLRLTQATKGSSEDAGEDELRPKATFETSFLVAIMTPDANQAQLLSTFIATISPGQTPVLQPTFRYTTLFLGEVATIAAHSPVLEWSVRAVSTSHLGRQVQDQHLIQLSRQMYRQALLTLNAALQDPIEGLSSRTLAATILLSFYEVINCTEKDSWVRHAGGAGHLMRLRGPERHRTGLGRACFLAYRHSLVIEAFLSRTATFLAVQPWADLSRDIQGSMSDRSAISDLIDDFHLLIVELPGFTQAAQDATASTASRRKLLTTGLAHRGNMHVLYKRIRATLDETDQEVTERASATGDPVVPAVYVFPSLAVGSLLCGYWASLTVLNRNLALLENNISAPTEAPSSIAQAAPARYHLRNSPSDGGKYLEENLRNARDSCKAAESLSCSAFLGPLYLIFALRVAFNTFAEGSEKEWVLARLEEVSAHLGIARALLEVQVQRAESASASTASLSRTTSIQEQGSLSGARSPELSRSTSGQEASRRGSVDVLSRSASAQQRGVRRGSEKSLTQGEDLSRRTSVSLQEIERRPSRQDEGAGSGIGKGKGVLR